MVPDRSEDTRRGDDNGKRAGRRVYKETVHRITRLGRSWKERCYPYSPRDGEISDVPVKVKW